MSRLRELIDLIGDDDDKAERLLDILNGESPTLVEGWQSKFFFSGHKFRAARLNCDMSMNNVALRMNMYGYTTTTERTVRDWEHGRVKSPGVGPISAACRAMSVSIYSVLDTEEDVRCAASNRGSGGNLLKRETYDRRRERDGFT